MVPADFVVPERLETRQFVFRPLRIGDVVMDYATVMESAATLKGVFGPGHDWPDGLTFEQDLIDLGWHQKEFQTRSSFAYTVLDPGDETRCLGCAYLYPPAKGFDAVAYCWVSSAALARGLDPLLYAAFRDWVERDWPFARVAYPGRDIDWAAWAAM